MPVIVPVYINETKIGSLFIARQKRGGMHKDAVNVYEVELEENSEKVYFADKHHFTIEHRYGDGVFALIGKALSRFEEITKS